MFQSRLLYHYLFWVTLIVTYCFDQLSGLKDMGITHFILLALERNLLLAAVVYCNIYYLIPKFYTKKKHTAYLLFVILSMLFFAVVNSVYFHYILNNVINSTNSLKSDYWFQFMSSFIKAGHYVFISFLLKVSVDWYDQQKKISEMRVEKLQAETNFIRSQVNPHFLFNTLNSVYALTLDRSVQAPDLVMKLSNMMRYMLEESNKEKVSLQADLKNLRDYIEIEKIRHNKRSAIDAVFEGNMENLSVLPNLFLPLVENAFKHGMDRLTSGTSVKIRLRAVNNEINFSVENIKPAMTEKNERKGTGIGNLVKRLELFYPGRHHFKIDDGGNIYKATLQLFV